MLHIKHTCGSLISVQEKLALSSLYGQDTILSGGDEEQLFIIISVNQNSQHRIAQLSSLLGSQGISRFTILSGEFQNSQWAKFSCAHQSQCHM